MATHSSIHSWRIPWTEKPGRRHSPYDGKESAQLKQPSTHHTLLIKIREVIISSQDKTTKIKTLGVWQWKHLYQVGESRKTKWFEIFCTVAWKLYIVYLLSANDLSLQALWKFLTCRPMCLYLIKISGVWQDQYTAVCVFIRELKVLTEGKVKRYDISEGRSGAFCLQSNHSLGKNHSLIIN